MRGAHSRTTRRSRTYLANFNDRYLLSRIFFSVINLVPSGRGAKSGRGSRCLWDNHIIAFRIRYFSCRRRRKERRERDKKETSRCNREKVKPSGVTAQSAKQCFGTHLIILFQRLINLVKALLIIWQYGVMCMYILQM